MTILNYPMLAMRPEPPVEDRGALHPVDAHVFNALENSVAEVRQSIADASTIAEAYTLFRYAKTIEAMLRELTTAAQNRLVELEREGA